MSNKYSWAVAVAGAAVGLIIYFSLRPVSCDAFLARESVGGICQLQAEVAPSPERSLVVSDEVGEGVRIRVKEISGQDLPGFSLCFTSGAGDVREVVTDDFGRAFVGGHAGEVFSVTSASPDWVLASTGGRPVRMIIGEASRAEEAISAVRVFVCGLAFDGGSPGDGRFMWDREFTEVASGSFDATEFNRIIDSLREEHGVWTKLFAPWPQVAVTGRVELLFGDKGRHQFPIFMQPPSLFRPYVIDVNAIERDLVTLPGTVVVKVLSVSGEAVDIGLVRLKRKLGAGGSDDLFKSMMLQSGVISSVPTGEYVVQLTPSQGPILDLKGDLDCEVSAGVLTSVVLQCSGDVREVQFSTPSDREFSLFRVSVPVEGGGWKWGPVRALAGPSAKMVLPVGSVRAALYSNDPDTGRLALFEVVSGGGIQVCDSDALLAHSTPSVIQKLRGK